MNLYVKLGVGFYEFSVTLLLFVLVSMKTASKLFFSMYE